MNQNLINPRISVAKVNTNIGDPMSPTTLKELLEYSLTLPVRTVYPEGDKRRNSEKKKDLWATAYTNGVRLGSGSDFDSDGALFIDIDHIDRELSDIIFNDFDSLCEALPCILAVVYSYSYGLHFFVYEPQVKEDSSKYTQYQTLYMCAIAEWANNKHNANFTVEGGNLDLHNSKIYQGLYFLNRPYKFNDHCAHITLDKESTKYLSKKYQLQSKLNSKTNTKKIRRNQSVVDTVVGDDEKILVNKDYIISGITGDGYGARSYIVGTILIHFNYDYDKSVEFLNKKFINASEMEGQMKSIWRGKYAHAYYDRTIELNYFPKSEKPIQLNQNQYLSDVLKFEDIKSKYAYIKSNTNTGKTEWVKNVLKNANAKIAVVQMNLALLDGKKQGVEDYVRGNDVKSWNDKDNSKLFTTIDGFTKYFEHRSVEDYVVILDESHLLETYQDFRPDVIRLVLDLIKTAKQVVFMSATPATDLDLFEFDVYTYIKKQPQTVKFNLHAIEFVGNGSKNDARYDFFTKELVHFNQSGVKSVIFSNKKQKYWQKYLGEGLDKFEKITLFNSANIRDEDVKAILSDNKLNNKTTLSTCYMGCGVEVKGEEKVRFIFDLDEGMDDNFIIQSIGRARDAKEIIVEFYDSNLEGGVVNQETFESAVKNLFVKEEMSNSAVLNLISAGLLNVRDPNFDTYDSKNLILVLKWGNYARKHQHFHNSDVSRITKLGLYEKVEVKSEEKVTLITDGRKTIRENEDKFIEQFMGWNQATRKKKVEGFQNKQTYHKVLETIEYNNIQSLKKLMDKLAFLLLGKCPAVDTRFDELFESFGSIDAMYRSFSYLRTAVKYWNGELALVEIKKPEDYKRKNKADEKSDTEKWLGRFEQVKATFTKEYIDYLIERRKGPVLSQEIEFEPDVFEMMEAVADYSFKGEILDPVFKATGKINRKKLNCSLASKGGKKTQNISIKNIETGEILNFASKSECKEWLKCSAPTFTQFLKGSSKLNKKFEVMG